jgi:hypothetical protein
LKDQVVRVRDYFPFFGFDVKIEELDVDDFTLNGIVLIQYFDRIPNLVRIVKEKDDGGSDVAQQRPLGKEGHTDNGEK